MLHCARGPVSRWSGREPRPVAGPRRPRAIVAFAPNGDSFRPKILTDLEMPTYDPSPKHKSWLRPYDPDATQCPAWSHSRALALLNESLTELGDDRRFATERGMAFAARVTRNDVWHGYPVPWAEVPEAVREQFVTGGKVTRRQIKRLLSSEALADELEP